MAESNKILTVSYGTFSCTLEGFDDAFTTMKAIAEYFRDLAADDRYFGAEPPTPDPELLAQLASRAAARRVEARRSDDGIVLRQDKTALPVEDAVTDEAAPAADAPVAEAPVAAAPVSEPVAETPAPEAVTSPAPAPEEISAPVATDEDTEADAFEDVVEEEVAPVEAVADETVSAPETEASATPKGLARPARHVVVTAPRTAPARPRVRVTATTQPARPAAPRPAPHPDANSVAAKLQRIRDVVSRDQAAMTAAGFSEDQHADDTGARAYAEEFETEADMIEPAAALMPDVADDAGSEDDADVGEAPVVAEEQTEDADDAVEMDFSFLDDDVAEELEPEVAEESDDIDLSAAMAIANTPDADEAEAEDIADADEAAAPEVAETAPMPQPRPVARVVKVKRSDFEAAVRDGVIEAEDEDQDETSAAIAGVEFGESSLSPEDEAELQSELKALEAEIARDSAGRSSDVADVVAEDEGDEDTDFWAEEDDVLAGDASDDFADDAEEDDADEAWADDFAADEDGEDDFDRGEAEYDAEAADAEFDDVEMDDEEDDAPAAPVNPRSRLLRRADDDMDRILAETNNQLGDTDGTRRRSAIAHLRAAVAATKAEKQAGTDLDDDADEETDAYRDDLAQVVRPRRPVVRSEGQARRAEDRPAPLKLVAEQRVDRETVTEGRPVRPRRVRVSDLAAKAEAQENAVAARDDMDHEAEAHARAAAAHAASFNEFADRVGAVDLPDILEAAASYLAFVEGRDQFTRPQLMFKARQALDEEFSREDGLRYFGRLLREGKLRKVAAGHFAVSDRINFRPEERAAG
ncbi:hypothetical protein GCM10011360_21260 [Primorskyibacter flagellatus]|uniref:Chemotaxis protein CheA n=1 Tax=Primorskyibacter flagellatus TaxID=1387277 RepID=A0A917A8H7_9RHOB|nr:hypothetical protein [Primorskyibacter flagellatus]GGE33141.1 hypothetical protein GCM10011360_21260 [Primorskyibacter flagellatus]